MADRKLTDDPVIDIAEPRLADVFYLVRTDLPADTDRDRQASFTWLKNWTDGLYAPTGHTSDPTAHQSLFDAKLDTGHASSGTAHQTLFDAKLDATHANDGSAHSTLFSGKVDTAHLTDANAHTTEFAAKENTGVAAGLVDDHNTSGTAHSALFAAKEDAGTAATEVSNHNASGSAHTALFNAKADLSGGNTLTGNQALTGGEYTQDAVPLLFQGDVTIASSASITLPSMVPGTAGRSTLIVITGTTASTINPPVSGHGEYSVLFLGNVNVTLNGWTSATDPGSGSNANRFAYVRRTDQGTPTTHWVWGDFAQ